MRYPAIKKPTKRPRKKTTTATKAPDSQRSARPAADDASGQPGATPG
jgi:hypothetical protein